MNAEEMRIAFFALHPEAAQADWDAWAYGDAPEELLALTLAGRKRATSSALPLYGAEDEPVPTAGGYSVLLDKAGNAACILRTTAVDIVPFRLISAEFAALEGEGDSSLLSWRRVHERFFTHEMAQAGLTFTEDMPVVCEEFEVVYR